MLIFFADKDAGDAIRSILFHFQGFLLNEHFFENHTYRTRHSTDLVRSLFSSLFNSLETQFFYKFFFDLLKGFYSKNIFWSTRTAVLIIKTCFGTDFSVNELSTSDIFSFFFFNFLKGFNWINIFLKIITTEPVIVQTWSGAYYPHCRIL